jgi:hypothetical protein
VSSFLTVPARTTMTAVFHGDNQGSFGIAVIDGQLCFTIAEHGGNRVMVARLDQASAEEFCGLLADHLPSIARGAVDAAKLGEALCARRQ